MASHNLKVEQIENIKEMNEYRKFIICYVCLEIPVVAMECGLCESIICDDCQVVLGIAMMPCAVAKCTGKIKKANKFIRDILSKIKISCDYCKSKGVEYKDYLKHLEECKGYKAADQAKVKLLKEVKDLTVKLERLSERADYVRQNSKSKSTDKSLNKRDTISKEMVRNSLMTFELPVAKKKELYNATIQGDLKEFKKLVVEKKYPVFEEISAKDYYWTSFHYAMHYGQLDIILFIFEYLFAQKKLEVGLLVTSSDDRCPVMCLLKSNHLDSEKKKIILTKLTSKFKFKMSSAVKDELRRRLMNDLLNNRQH